MADTTEKIQVTCPGCSARMRVPASAAGRRGTCPKCGGKFEVPRPTAAAAVASPAASPATEEEDWLDGLGGGEPVAAPPPPPPSPGLRPCPACSAPLAGGAVLCTKCGFDTRKGAAVKMAPTSLGDGAQIATRLAGGSRLLLGCVGCAIGAAIGGGVWYAIAVATLFESGWIAWGIGLLAGAGMWLGARETGMLHGAIAAALAALAIVGAKYAVVATLFSATGGTFDPFEGMSDLEIVTTEMTDAALESASAELTEEDLEREPTEEELAAEDAAWEAEEAKQRAEAQKLSPEELKTRAAAARAAAAEAVEQFRAAFQGVIFRSMFGWLDLLFFALAIGTAFKIGATGWGGGD